MSIQLMTLIWQIEFPTQSQLLVALKLADHANDEGTNCYPSRSRIAEMTQCSESTVKNALRAFREVGLLHVIAEGGKGPKSTTKYAFHMRLVHSLQRGDCRLVSDGEKVKLEWPDMGSEFDPLKGLEFDPLEEKRGQLDGLRGQPDASKGSKALTPNHQETSKRNVTRADTRASDGARALSDAKKGHLVLPQDAEWADWLGFARKRLGKMADAFVQEGGMLVYDEYPHSDAQAPKLPPVFGSDKYLAAVERREARGLTTVSKRMTGEHAQ